MARRSICMAGVLVLCWLALSMAVLPPAAADPGSLFVSPAGSGTACSQAAPCGLQTALGLAVGGDTIYVAGGTYTGSGAAVVTLTRSIALLGGWDGAATGPVVRDPAAHPSTLDGEYARRVVHISGNIGPTLDGLVVTRGDASGLAGQCPSQSAGCGGGIYVTHAHPIISNNVITANIAAITDSGSAANYTAHGGGLYFVDVDVAMVTANDIFSNSGSGSLFGVGGGMYLWGAGSGMLIEGNRIVGNWGATGTGAGSGAGIYLLGASPTIRGNKVEGNHNQPSPFGEGAAIGQFGGEPTCEGNLIRGNSGWSAVSLMYSRALMTGNRIINNQVTEGVRLESGSGTGATLANNVIAGSGATGIGVHGYNASYLITVTLAHNTVVGNGSSTGVYGDFATMYMTNNIVVSHAVAITDGALAGSTILPDHTLFWANAAAGIPGAGAVSGSPDFVNPAAFTYHIGAASAAIDQGAAAWVATDIDGEPRFGVPDVGADEYWAPGALKRAFLPVVMK